MELQKMKRPTLLEIIRTALYIGTIGYGGPAILALMKKVIVHEKAWISEEEFMNALSLSQILPGATGVSLWGYIGHKLRKPWGGILAPFSFVLPAMFAITVLAWAYFTYGNLTFVHSIFMGLGALVVALLINATLIMGKSVFPKMDRNSYKGITIAALSFLGITFLHWNVVYIILISGVFGVLFFYFSGEFEQEKMPGHLKVEIDVPKVRQAAKLSAAYAYGFESLPLSFGLLPEHGRFYVTFLKIGALAFGGGFTAIPLIQHVVVDGMHWLNLTAFRDGIALGQIRSDVVPSFPFPDNLAARSSMPPHASSIDGLTTVRCPQNQDPLSDVAGPDPRLFGQNKRSSHRSDSSPICQR
ncbi:MAG: chromate transporter [Desulfobacterales bacterium]|nr:chromate transporter [Desulfobacterales bacterium]